MSFGVGGERTFPVHCPVIAKRDITRMGDVRRPERGYLRESSGKSAEIGEKRAAR